MRLATGTQIDHGTIPGQLVRALRDQIVSGDLPAGARLVQGKLADDFGVSITPVREALHELSAQGFVRMDSRKSVTVVGLTSQDLEHLYDVRKLLEGQAVRIACDFLTDEDYTSLRDLAQKMMQVRDVDEWYSLNATFHNSLYAICRNRHLCRMIDQVREQSEPYVRTYVSITDLSRPAHQHEEILELCRRNEPDRAERALVAHLDTTARSVASALEEVEKRRTGTAEVKPT